MWLEVERPEDKCWVDEEDAPEECEAQWENAWIQCLNYEEGQ